MHLRLRARPRLMVVAMALLLALVGAIAAVKVGKPLPVKLIACFGALALLTTLLLSTPAAHGSPLPLFTDETGTRLPVESNRAVRAAAGDVDGDGDLDIVVASGLHNQIGNVISDQDFLLQINNGVGIFTNEASTQLPPSAFGMRVASAAVLGDVDGDSDLDIFVTNGTSGGGFPANFSGFQNLLWINNGAGVFTDETGTRLPAVTDVSFHAAFGDVDGDGDLDILVGNVGSNGSGEQNRLLINDGAGVFTDETAVRLPALAGITLSVALNDLDGDTDLDIVVNNTSGTVSRVLINDGAGVFTDETATRLSLADTSQDVKVADFNGDGSVDILFSSLPGRPRLFINSGSGIFTEETSARIPDTFFTGGLDGSHGLALADVDNDRDVDVFVTVPGFQHRLLLNNGAGFFTDATLAELPSVTGTVRYATFADVDNDGDADLYIPTSDPATQNQDRLLVNSTVSFAVNSTGDGGDSDTADGVCDDGTGKCTLRAAIEQANASVGKDTIAFNIPGAGPHTIQPTSALPTITDPVVIDGYTQPGASPNTNGPGLGLNTVLKIELDGTNAGDFVDGLVITAGNSTVRGMVINRFLANVAVNPFKGAGIRTSTNGSNVIEGNFIGTDVTGSVDFGNSGEGVAILTGANNRIGGTIPGARNVISGNFQGVIIWNDATSNAVEGNFIGTNATGTAALGNTSGNGVMVFGDSNTIGGTAAGAGNVISASGIAGVQIFGVDGVGNMVLGNLIGTDVTGAVDLGNLQYGVAVFDASSNTIGGTAVGTGNVILGNNLRGVLIMGSSATSNSILGNSIFSNVGLGIDLGFDGISPNDAGDGDTGSNNLQNFPVLTSVVSGSTNIQGTLNSTPSTIFRVEFFSSSACDPSGNGEGETFLGFKDVTTDGTGNVSFTATFATSVAVGDLITATATDANNNTSEFSQCLSAALIPTAVPSLSQWGFIGMAGLFAVLVLLGIRLQGRVRRTAG